jgi:uncharacterized protein DUF3224
MKLVTTIAIDDWQESPTQEFGDGTKICHAVVRLSKGRDGLTGGHMESVLHYREDGTSNYVTVLRLEGTLDGRAGSFVAIGDGVYDGTSAGGTMRIVSGSGELGTISGTVGGESTHDDYPQMPLVIEYDLS